MEVLGDFNTTVKKALGEIDPNYLSYPGVVICGTHTPRLEEVPALMHIIKNCREQNIPLLGICYGHQLVAIEYARNVLGVTDATSEEFGDEGTKVVKKKQSLNVGLREGQSYWNNYEVVLPDWQKPLHFYTSQFHPEYQSSKQRPHPLLKEFLKACKSA